MDRRIEKVVMLTRGPVYIHGEVAGKLTLGNVNKNLLEFEDQKRFSYETYKSGYENTISRIVRQNQWN